MKRILVLPREISGISQWVDGSLWNLKVSFWTTMCENKIHSVLHDHIVIICFLFISHSHISLDSFPRLDPPPPTGKKRLPRALKTTQDMMISSDPVVASPESSFVSSPEKISKDKAELQPEPSPEKPSFEKPSESGDRVDSQTEKTPGLELKNEPTAVVTDEKNSEDVDPSQLLLSVPDLIHKDNLDPKKLAASETRMASTPCPGKGGCRISVTEGELLGNGTVDYRISVNLENEESHPDLLSFE